MTVSDKIKELFIANHELSVSEITTQLGVSKQMVHRVIKVLVEDKTILKLGSPPKTLYKLNVNKDRASTIDNHPQISDGQTQFLVDNFLLISETGEYLKGVDGFSRWCNQRKLPLEKTLDEYILTKNRYDSYYNSEQIIDGTPKLLNSYQEETYLDKVFYVDFYAIERFGKTKLGTILHFAKQGQNKFLMQKLIEEVKTKILTLINKHKYDAVCFVPPTIRREVQIMKYIKDHLNIPLPVIEIKKISGLIPVPQKSLNKIDQRINNARETFAVTEQRKFKNVLVIDDAVGSGATLNQIALKIKSKKISTKVNGLAIVGSFKGFDVITDI